jgi:hypothetical protein
MNYLNSGNAVRAFSIVLLCALCACASGQDAKSEKKLAKEEKRLEKEAKYEKKMAKRGDVAETLPDLSRFAASGCDASLWNRVYNPTRLEKLADCVKATGTVEESLVDPDGDQHFLLKLDPGQEALVNPLNAKKKKGDLVVEIVCANPVALPKVKDTCSGYTNRIPLPTVGAHYVAIGSYVIDSHNGWAEIHPASIVQRG